GLLGVALEFRRRPRLGAPERCQPRLARVHGLEGLILGASVRQAQCQTRIEERDGEVAAVATLVAGARVRCEADEAALGPVFPKRGQIAVPRTLLLSRDVGSGRLLLDAWIGHDRDRINRRRGLGWGELRVGAEHG